MQTIEQLSKLYKDAIEDVKVAEEKRNKIRKQLEDMRSEVEAALGIEKVIKPIYRSGIGGD